MIGRLYWLVFGMLIVTLTAFTFSGSGSPFVANEQVTPANMNEIDAALDSLETLEVDDPENRLAPDTTAVSSPFRVERNDWETWFNIDGEAGPIEGEGGGVVKTTAIGLTHYVVNLTNTEVFGTLGTLLLGGDGDGVGTGMEVHCTGGAHAQGNEGCQGYRSRVTDTYLTAFGNVVGAVTSGAGTQTVALSNISEAESRMLGENKLMTFPASEVVVTISDAPPGTINNGVIEDFPAVSWSFDGTGLGQGVWTLGAGQVTSSGVQSSGWCFSAVDADYTDINTQPTKHWLEIVAINSGTNTITTRWENQGYNGLTPYGYLAGEGASEGRVVPCVELGRPIFNAGDFTADSLPLIKGAGFPGVLAGAAFDVGAYAGIAQVGFRALISNKLGRMYVSDGFKPTNQIDGGAFGGRYMLGYALDPDFAGSLANLKDGERHAWEAAVGCEVPGDCKQAVRFVYAPDPDNLNFNQWFASIDWASEDWLNDIDRIVIRTDDDNNRNLTLDRTDGWGMNGDAFLRESQVTSGTATPTDGSTACNTRDTYLETDRRVIFYCVDGATDDWWGVQLLDDVP